MAQYNATKMKELVLYLARRHEGDPTFGRVKIAKLLFYSDCEAYRTLGASITGADYQKLPHGPAARQYLPAFASMAANGDAHEVQSGMGFKVVADREPDSDVFEPGEVKIVDEVVDRFRGWSATKISQKSHEEVGWRVAAPGDVIPYPAYLFAPDVSSDHKNRAAKLAADKGWIGEPF